MRRTVDPAPSCNPDRRNQKYGYLRTASAAQIVVALSSPPKCGCDVNSAAGIYQVAKFAKYAGFILVISVV